MNVSKSRISPATVAESKSDEDDVALSVGHDIIPADNKSSQAKSKASKSSFTVFGLQPSPELLSISMGTPASLQARRPNMKP